MSKNMEKIVLKKNEKIEGFVDTPNPVLQRNENVEGFVIDDGKKNENSVSTPLAMTKFGQFIAERIKKVLEKINLEANTTTESLTMEEKRTKILEDYNLTEDQFNVLCAIVLTEAKANSYDDAYAVINTIYNRCHSKKWVDWGNHLLGQGKGDNLYYQATMSGQFVVYQSGKYRENLNNTTSVGYTAIIDFLTTEESKHNYLSFKSSNTNVRSYEQFDENGNKYHDLMSEDDRIVKEESSD